MGRVAAERAEGSGRNDTAFFCGVSARPLRSFRRPPARDGFNCPNRFSRLSFRPAAHPRSGQGHVLRGGLLLLLSGVADTLDGQVARGGAMATKFGAFYDSTLDRVGDGATFIGIGAFFLTAPDVAYRTSAVIACMVAVLSSLLVSYARARAEGLGIDCKVGIAQRAERILLVGVCSLVVGAGTHALLLEGVVALLAVASVITVVQRFV